MVVKQDPAESFKWFRKAAEHGSTGAMLELGEAYLTGGWGLEKDKTEALKWFQLAAKQRSKKAKEKLKDFGK